MDSLLPKRESRRLILVHHSLPLSLQKIAGGGYWSFHDRNLASLASSVHLLKENNIIDDYIWVGCPVSDQFKPLSGTSNDDSEEDRNKLQKDLEDNNCYPVETINSKLYEDACINFANKSLKNIFHYEVSEIKFDENHWKSYKEFNRQFAWKIEQLYKPGDIIWIHGLQLLTLPRLLRINNPNMLVGFFLHSPFPAVEVFRCLASRKKILKGMLGANLVAFQAYSYSRYFYQSCTRILGTPAGFDGVKYRDEKISGGGEFLTKISVFSEGIDPNITLNILKQEDIKQRINELKETFKGKKIIISKDQGEATEGTKNKLLAFELFLKKNPSLVKDVVLFLVCEPIKHSVNLHNSNSISCKKDKIISTINETVARINGEYGKVGNIPIQYINRYIDYEELCSLFQVADILLSAPLREGMNLDTHDFVVCHENSNNNSKPGILILSEFDGASRCFGGALLVNPYSVNEISQGIHDAINLSNEEALIKHRHNFEYVNLNTSYLWGEAFLYDILQIYDTTPEPNKPCSHLESKSLDKSYRLAEKRLLIFDYDGAFKKILPGSPQPYLPARIANILKKLSKDTKNIIYVITSRDKDTFENLLENIPVGLGCENGSFLKSSTGIRPTGEWQNLSEGIDMSWKEIVVPILEHFSERLPGSSLLVNSVTVTFSYENCSNEYSADNAQELLTTLMEVAGKTPIDISNNNKIIEIKPSGTGSSVAMKKVIEENPEIDFILCIGDDKTEQGVFDLLDRNNPHHFAVSVGKKKSYSKYFVNNQNQVLQMLEIVSTFESIISPPPPPLSYISSISLKSSPVVDSGSAPNVPHSSFSLPI
ncbi:hypothetical protein DICPUDRAFT_47494 [Dictyostelium purpureum]|uniref:Uncharacterized protein n=1 Tax=Dictyostelium purpureum TaxID=5786 RepID=F0ZJS2_DICPU|nr:uncharacterized protein DICPUDRAFT_47494 [Dictyostelium purpureum]EGC35831.1 hypothetical protein DICPUDRAFT_47494 [Dictyostelium purpureum]|eukprot:XP_003287668.1 hypothetical protein DICPUDRAFT_47494 [Dictyostelium purpureum]